MNKAYLDKKGNVIDFYEILNIPYKAEKELIRSAFCNLIKVYHPDISGKETDEDRSKIELIVRGYKILIDEDQRKDYTRHLFSSRKQDKSGYIPLPRNRIKYSISFKDLVSTKLLNKKIRRRDRVGKFGQDIEIFITKKECETGAIAYIELPSRMDCYECYGSDKYCNICRGLGRIPTVSRLEVKIHPDTENGSQIEVDLMKVRPDKFTYYTMKNIRIKITVMGGRQISMRTSL